MDTFSEVKKKNEIKYNNWSSYLENTRDRTNYATRRMDLLIISICGAGIYIIFETFREVNNETLIVDDITVLKVSGVLFLISIVANFASQLTGYNANNNEEMYTIQKLRKLAGKSFDKSKKDNANKLSANYTMVTKILNIVSTSLMLFGLMSLTIFYYYYLF